MPIEVFNHTYGRDEEKVFGENTNRSFGSVEVPSVGEFGALNAQLGQLQREHHDFQRWRADQAAHLKDLGARMMDRQHAETVLAEIQATITDTTIFTKALHEALDSFEHRISEANSRARQEVVDLQQQAEASTAAAKVYLDTFQSESGAVVQSLQARQIELIEMLAIAQQLQIQIRLRQDDADALRRWQDWSSQVSCGGFWARLTWLFRG